MSGTCISHSSLIPVLAGEDGCDPEFGRMEAVVAYTMVLPQVDCLKDHQALLTAKFSLSLAHPLSLLG